MRHTSRGSYQIGTHVGTPVPPAPASLVWPGNLPNSGASPARASRVGTTLPGTTLVIDDSVMRRNHALRDAMQFARDIISDGTVSHAQAKGFQAWIESNPDIQGIQAVDEIVGILANVFADGRLTEEEKAQLTDVLERFGG